MTALNSAISSSALQWVLGITILGSIRSVIRTAALLQGVVSTAAAPYSKEPHEQGTYFRAGPHDEAAVGSAVFVNKRRTRGGWLRAVNFDKKLADLPLAAIAAAIARFSFERLNQIS